MNSKEFESFLESIDLKTGNDKKPIKNRYFFEVGDGWLQLIKNLIKALNQIGWNQEIYQVKEKFGGLRFDVTTETTDESLIISRFEKESCNICEICGKFGETIKKNGWLSTKCDEHK